MLNTTTSTVQGVLSVTIRPAYRACRSALSGRGGGQGVPPPFPPRAVVLLTTCCRSGKTSHGPSLFSANVIHVESAGAFRRRRTKGFLKCQVVTVYEETKTTPRNNAVAWFLALPTNLRKYRPPARNFPNGWFRLRSTRKQRFILQSVTPAALRPA